LVAVRPETDAALADEPFRGFDARSLAGLWRELDLALGLDIGPPR
jgi:hypothetical protein